MRSQIAYRHSKINLDEVFANCKKSGECLEWKGKYEITIPILGMVRLPRQVFEQSRYKTKKRVTRKCHNYKCLNPDHLVACDSPAPYRAVQPDTQGMKNGVAKLTDEDIIEIRKLYATGRWTYPLLGERFNTDKSNIGLIVRKLHWKHIGD
jgi:hypothetical protein